MALLKSCSQLSKWMTVSKVQIQDKFLEAGITCGLKVIWKAPKCPCVEKAITGFLQYSHWALKTLRAVHGLRSDSASCPHGHLLCGERNSLWGFLVGYGRSPSRRGWKIRGDGEAEWEDAGTVWIFYRFHTTQVISAQNSLANPQWKVGWMWPLVPRDGHPCSCLLLKCMGETWPACAPRWNTAWALAAEVGPWSWPLLGWPLIRCGEWKSRGQHAPLISAADSLFGRAEDVV